MAGKTVYMAYGHTGTIVCEQWELEPFSQSAGGCGQGTVFPGMLIGLDLFTSGYGSLLMTAETMLLVETLTLGFAPPCQDTVFGCSIVGCMTEGAGAAVDVTLVMIRGEQRFLFRVTVQAEVGLRPVWDGEE